jgi:hypothetical protein
MSSLYDLIPGSDDCVKESLRSIYAAMLQHDAAFDSREAEHTASSWVDIAETAAREWGTLGLPRDFGDQMILRSLEDPYYRTSLESKKTEGVTDSDIRWWWNMHDIQRRMFHILDDFFRAASFLAHRNRGTPPAQAASEVRRFFPFFGNPNDPGYPAGEDRRLPEELRRRVDEWVERQKAGPEVFKQRAQHSSTMNAIIRRDIQDGVL